MIAGMKLFLCSTGFDNEKLVPHFQTLLDRPVPGPRALLIPTALRTPKARAALPLFIEDLRRIGVAEDDIITVELDGPVEEGLLDSVDLVLVCPGDPEYLLERLQECGFIQRLRTRLEGDLPYIGISAGADIVAANHPGGLNLIDRRIECHAVKGSSDGPVDRVSGTLFLTDDQALILDGDRMEIVS